MDMVIYRLVFFFFRAIENASRGCQPDGHWSNYTNYDLCQHVPDTTEFDTEVELPTIIYKIGYTISLISLSLAVAVFVHFK